MTDEEMRRRADEELRAAGGFTTAVAAELVAAVRRGEMTQEQARERIPVTLTYEQVAAEVDRLAQAPTCGHKEAVYRCAVCAAYVRAKYPEFPVCVVDRFRNVKPGPTAVPWAVAEKAWQSYAHEYGTGQSVERMAQRGGFDWAEMDSFFPGWREATDEWVKLERERDEAARILAEVQAVTNAHATPGELMVSTVERLAETARRHASLSARFDRWCDALAEALPAGVRASTPEKALSVVCARVKALGMAARDARRDAAGFRRERDAAESDLAAIRRRGNDYRKSIGELDEHCQSTVLEVIGALLADDAPAPSELDGMHGEMADPNSLNPDATSEADQPYPEGPLFACPERICEHVGEGEECTTCAPPACPAPTTTEAFATLRRCTEHHACEEGAAALSPLERRMRAQEAALRGCRTHLKCTEGCACDVCAALTDAQPVFTPEEVETAILEEWPVDKEMTPNAFAAKVRKALTALRVKP